MGEMIELESLRRLDIQPGEALLVRLNRPLSTQEMHEVRQRIQPYLPDGVKVLVVGSDADLAVVPHPDDPHRELYQKHLDSLP